MGKTNSRSTLGVIALILAACSLGGCDQKTAPPVPQGTDGGLGRVGAPAAMDDDPAVARFKKEAAGYLALQAELRPLERKFSDGTITEPEVDAWRTLEAEYGAERNRLNVLLYDESVTPEQRRAMFWILRPTT
ncbi:MAG: hypothetical protein P8J59_12615 [Phycisphaerales bacterium]|jgi:hypothetical protein|nr:hypothetical protein [Phycisphaerales bacterium]